MPQKQNLEEKLESNLRYIKQLERENEETKKQIESGMTEIEIPPFGEKQKERMRKAYSLARKLDDSYFLLHKEEKEMPHKINLEEQLKRKLRRIKLLERENEKIKKQIESGITEIEVPTPEERIEMFKSYFHTIDYFKFLLDKEEKKKKEQEEKDKLFKI